MVPIREPDMDNDDICARLRDGSKNAQFPFSIYTAIRESGYPDEPGCFLLVGVDIPKENLSKTSVFNAFQNIAESCSKGNLLEGLLGVSIVFRIIQNGNLTRINRCSIYIEKISCYSAMQLDDFANEEPNGIFLNHFYMKNVPIL